jgi:simple sugar transport system permease protein
VGRNHPAGVVIAALLFATLSQGGLAVNALVPKQMVDVLTAVVIIAVATAVPEVRRALAAARRRPAGTGAREQGTGNREPSTASETAISNPGPSSQFPVPGSEP